jgi:two-component system, chemotaxis family, CheB/CheR fusion protein
MQELYGTLAPATAVSTTDGSNRQETRHRGAAIKGDAQTIFVVDEDAAIRETIRELLVGHGFRVECFADGPAFLRAYQAGHHHCLLIDVRMPRMGGIALVEQIKTSAIDVPAIMMCSEPLFHVAVRAMKAGAVDFIEKPLRGKLLLAAVKTALGQSEAVVNRSDIRKAAVRRVSSLTQRQREILDLVVAGCPSKNIAADLHISQRTVENHRAAIARKTRSKSLSALIQTAICANCSIRSQS